MVDSEDTYKHLKESLELIFNHESVGTHYNQMVRHGERWKSKLMDSPYSDWNFNMTPNWEIEINARNQHNAGSTILSGNRGGAYLLIGGETIARKGEIHRNSITVCIAIKNANPPKNRTSKINVNSCCRTNFSEFKRVTRRFHFDYNTDKIKTPERFPISHLQFGGKLDKSLCPEDYHYCLDHHIELPRLHFPPYDLVLTLDFFLNEFSTPISTLVEGGDWKSFVRKSEEIWIKSHYDDVNHYFNGNPDNFYTLDGCLSRV